VPWVAPDLWDNISSSVASKILDEIDAGFDGGKQRFSDAPAATDRAAYRLVMRHVPSLTEGQARKVIKTWVMNGVPVPRLPRQIGNIVEKWLNVKVDARGGADDRWQEYRCQEPRGRRSAAGWMQAGRAAATTLESSRFLSRRL
jgi:hypothetical protein